MQTQRVLNRLRQGPLTAKQAMEQLGIGRLAARVRDLREAGHDIHTETRHTINRHGEACKIGLYRLIKEARG